MEKATHRDPGEILMSNAPAVQKIIIRVIHLEYDNIHWKRPPRINDDIEKVIKEEVKQ